MVWAAAADRKGYAYYGGGLEPATAIAAYRRGSLGYLEPSGTLSNNSIQELIEQTSIDGYFLALPNLPNTFMADVARCLFNLGGEAYWLMP